MYRELLKKRNMVSEEEKEDNLVILRKKYSGHHNLKQESEIEKGYVLGPGITLLDLYPEGS